MVTQLAAPQTLSWLLPPQMPPQYTMNAYGFRLQTDGSHVITHAGHEAGPVAQRIVAATMLRLESRERLAERYALSVRHVQEIATGAACQYLKAPVIRRLHELGIGAPDEPLGKALYVERVTQAYQALGRVAALASEMIVWPERYSTTEREQVSADLYLLSGAWLEDGR